MKKVLYLLMLICIAVVSYRIFSDIPFFEKPPAEETVISSYAETTDFVFSYRAQLSKNESVIYDSLFKQIQSGKTECVVYNISRKDYEQSLKKVIEAVLGDHPEFFWLNGGAKINASYYTQSSRSTVNVSLSCLDELSNNAVRQAYTAAVEMKIAEITEQANAFSTDYEKALFVHDLIIENTDYDFSLLSEDSGGRETAYTVYGCLVEGKAVCSGYAKAYQLILNRLGIPCLYVSGTANGQSHGWNCIQLDGASYFVDPTWDDAQFSQENADVFPNEAQHNYFGLTTEELNKTHAAASEFFEIPYCNSTIYNYFYQSDFVLPTYNFNSFCNIIDRQADKRILAVRFADQTALENAKNDLFQKNACSKIMRFAFSQISYAVDEEHLILTFVVQ